MKRSTHHILGTCVLITGIAFCGSLIGQTPASGQNGGDASKTVNPTQPAQSETPPRPPRSDESFIIGDDDVLAISVWKEADLSRVVPVRSDGKISLPLVGEVQAAGRTPLQLEEEITAKLRSYITDPQVTVIVQQINSQKFNILGQVNKSGSFQFAAGTTIVDAIALAGGLRDFAKKKAIYILRQTPNGGQVKIMFNYDDFLKGKNTDKNILIKPHDTLVVP